jgi:hypothetical protein
MTSSGPNGNGLKKPLNMLESPVFPDIKKAMPRFVWSKKHWTVDAGATLRDTEPFNQFIEPAILAQSRTYNKTIYGQSSHKDIVNAEFRPPLESYYEDVGPLTRVPATIEAIFPRVNPSTISSGGTSGYTAKNERLSDVSSALTDRIKHGEARPTFYCPMDDPIDNSILPDLELKLPPISVHAGWEVPFRTTQETPNIDLGESKLQAVPINSGYATSIRIDGPNKFENYEARNNRPTYSADAGMNTPYQMNSETPTIELFENRPHVSVGAGMNTPYQMNMETPITELFENRPNVSVGAGMNAPYKISSAETPTIELFENRPHVSVSSGMNTPYQMNMETPITELVQKLDTIPITVINPGSEDGYKYSEPIEYNTDTYIHQNIPNYSYTVPSQDPVFRTRNEETRPHFREKLQPEKSYGKISQSSGIIPSFGIGLPTEFINDTTSRAQRPSKYTVNKKKSIYRF